MQTIFKHFQEITGKYPKNVALGYKIDGHYKTINFRRLLEKINRLVTGFRKLGITEGDRVVIFSNSRHEYIRADLALNKIGAITVPIHTSLSPRLIKYIIDDAGASFLIIGDLLSKFQQIEKQVNLKKVITFNQIEWRQDFIYFDDLYKEDPDQEAPADFAVCNIIYTSGTTGDPKGVMLTNENFLSNIVAAAQYVPYTSRDVFLSFLPLSHILERTAGYLAPLYFGAAIYFADSPKTIADDIKKAKPTILVCVPRIFEKVYEKVMDKVRASSKLKQNLVYTSLSISRAYLNAKKENSSLKIFLRLTHFLSDHFVLNKIRQALGGRLKYAIAGGAALNPAIAKFFETIGIKVLEGYGLTETSPIIAVNPVKHYKFGTVGKIIPGVEVKLAEDDEILTKGPNVMKGYYNDEKRTKEAFDDEGWFKTGDLGHLDQDGYLTIIGRKKEMIITSTGKNINPADLENALVESRYINQAMVYGDRQKYLSALIVPDYEELKKYAEENNLKLEYFQLLKNSQVIEFYQQEINNQLKDFPDNEQVRKFILLEKEFSEEREELTPSLKLRRDKILNNYKHLVGL